MNDPPVAVAAFAGEVEDFRFLVEGHAHVFQPRDGGGGVLNHKFNRFAAVQPCTGDHGIIDMIFKRVACIEHGGNPALRP